MMSAFAPRKDSKCAARIQYEHGKATVHRQLLTQVSKHDPEGISNRWPHIRRFLRIDPADGVRDNFSGWSSCAERKLSPAERAAAYEEWADFHAWHLARRAPELAGDRRKRHLVEKWTDSMAYSFRRSAAWARGDDPGKWVSQWERRPDLYVESQAIVADIVAELDSRRRPAACLAMAG